MYVLGRSEAMTPNKIPRLSAMHIAKKPSLADTGNFWLMISPTVRFGYLNDCRVGRWVMYWMNCLCSGWSRLNCLFNSSRTSAVTCLSSSNGPPGARRHMKNVIAATQSNTGMVSSTRRRMNLSIRSALGQAGGCRRYSSAFTSRSRCFHGWWSSTFACQFLTAGFSAYTRV